MDMSNEPGENSTPTKQITLTHDEMGYILERMRGSRSKKHKEAIKAKIHAAFGRND
jgi:hypothetical protein